MHAAGWDGVTNHTVVSGFLVLFAHHTAAIPHVIAEGIYPVY